MCHTHAIKKWSMPLILSNAMPDSVSTHWYCSGRASLIVCCISGSLDWVWLDRTMLCDAAWADSTLPFLTWSDSALLCFAYSQVWLAWVGLPLLRSSWSRPWLGLASLFVVSDGSTWLVLALRACYCGLSWPPLFFSFNKMRNRNRTRQVCATRNGNKHKTHRLRRVQQQKQQREQQ